MAEKEQRSSKKKSNKTGKKKPNGKSG